MQSEEPMLKLPPAQNEPLFLHVPLDGQGKGDGAADVKVIHGRYLGLVRPSSAHALQRGSWNSRAPSNDTIITNARQELGRLSFSRSRGSRFLK